MCRKRTEYCERRRPNKSLHPTATRLDASGCGETLGRRIGCRCPVPVAVGELPSEVIRQEEVGDVSWASC